MKGYLLDTFFGGQRFIGGENETFFIEQEIARIGDRSRRVRMGETTWEISRGFTLASFRQVAQHEIEWALVRRYPGIAPEPFELLGKGFAHAFGIDYAYRCAEEYRGGVSI